MDVNPVILEDRIYLPVRFAAELMGMKVIWDNEGKKFGLVSKSTANEGIGVAVDAQENKAELKQEDNSHEAEVITEEKNNIRKI